MATFSGIVKGNVVLLKTGEHLPDGSEVEVRLVREPVSREQAFARIRADQITRRIGIDEIIEEEKLEREEPLGPWPKDSNAY